jgi:aromatic-amino-acid transaminase
MASPLFARVELAPKDPILGVTEAFVADKNPNKVNLGVGVYNDDNGKLPLLACVKLAEEEMAKALAPRGYLPIDGLAAYDSAVRDLVFGADSEIVKNGRAVTVQGLGGTGGLKIGADFLKRINPDAEVWISDPSWENHRALFEGAGFTVRTYPYYDATKKDVDFAAMLAALQGAPAGTIIVLHVCCHNPTGYDITPAQWAQVVTAVRARDLVPFLDFAYQGFAEGIDADGAAVHLFAATPGPLLVSSSFSKSFSLYGERVGALSAVGKDAEEAARLLSQLKRIVRTNYSNPPTHGGKIVVAVLGNPALRKMWEDELGDMRERIKKMRVKLVESIEARVPGSDFKFIARQRGMFSYSGLTKEQVGRLRNEYSIYAIDTGRICVAALNSKNIDYVADAIARVIK